MTFLADTSVTSEIVRRDPNPGALSWAHSVSSVVISAVIVEETFFGLAWKSNQRIRQWNEQFFAVDCRISPVTIEIARCSGVLRERFAARGQQRTQADMLIAATAQLRQLTLVTRNIRDFEGCGVAFSTRSRDYGGWQRSAKSRVPGRSAVPSRANVRRSKIARR